MKREIITTQDGTKTILLPELKETYHSKNGALQEAEHVFIKNGLSLIQKTEIKVFEMGFGTGLNSVLCYRFSNNKNIKIHYTGIEAYPVNLEDIKTLEFNSFLSDLEHDLFVKTHDSILNNSIVKSKQFEFELIVKKIQDYKMKESAFDVIFYDAFGPRIQGDLWGIDLLEKMYFGLKKGGLLTTYCAQGEFKRNLRSIGFNVEAVAGPPGKREMTLAWKK